VLTTDASYRDIAATLDAIANGTDQWYLIDNRVGDHFGLGSFGGLSGFPSLEEAVRDAVQYRLTFGEGGGGRVSLEPWLEADEAARPVRVESCGLGHTDVWRALANACTDPALKARFHHLLFQAKVHHGHLHAREAVDGYVDATEGDWDRGDALEFGRAALRLAVALKDKQRVERALCAIRDTVVSAGTEGAPGLVAVGLVAIARERELPFDFDALADSLLESVLFGDNADHVLAACIRRAPEKDRPALWERRVRMAVKEAEATSDTLVKVVRLQEALRQAEAANRSDLRKDVAALLQRAGRQPSGMSSFGVIHRMAQRQVDAEIDRMISGDRLARSLESWTRWGPPSGPIAANVRAANNVLASPILGMVTMGVLNSDNLPIYSPSTPEERHDMEMVRSEVENVATGSRWLASGLHRIVERHGLPQLTSLAGYLRTWPGFDEAGSWVTASSLLRYWSHDYQGAFYVVIPQIERTIRNLLLWADVGIYREQRDQKPGQYPGVGVLLDSLNETYRMKQDWYRYYYACLAHPTGLNVRNAAAHGLIEVVPHPSTALVLHMVLSLGTLSPPDADTPQR